MYGHAFYPFKYHIMLLDTDTMLLWYHCYFVDSLLYIYCKWHEGFSAEVWIRVCTFLCHYIIQTLSWCGVLIWSLCYTIWPYLLISVFSWNALTCVLNNFAKANSVPVKIQKYSKINFLLLDVFRQLANETKKLLTNVFCFCLPFACHISLKKIRLRHETKVRQFEMYKLWCIKKIEFSLQLTERWFQDYTSNWSWINETNLLT